MARQDIERQKELQPKRIEYAIEQINKLGLPIVMFDAVKIIFMFKGEKIIFHPYSGWHSGKSIVDGRGLNNLIKQLKA